MARKLYVTFTVDAIIWIDEDASPHEVLDEAEMSLDFPTFATVEDCTVFGWEITDAK